MIVLLIGNTVQFLAVSLLLLLDISTLYASQTYFTCPDIIISILFHVRVI